MTDVARARLIEERKALQRDRPLGCWAKPKVKANGETDLFTWRCGIVPSAGSLYARPDGEVIEMQLSFPPEYPAKPPVCTFTPPIYHCNVWPSGIVCMSLLLEHGHHPGQNHTGFWQAGLSIGTILRSMIAFLDEPNPKSIANADACAQKTADDAAYERTVRARAARYAEELAQFKAAGGGS